MRKLSPQFYSNLLSMYVDGTWVKCFGGGYKFALQVKPSEEFIHLYWNEINEHYPLATKANPSISVEVDEVREFCEQLENIPLLKALK